MVQIIPYCPKSWRYYRRSSLQLGSLWSFGDTRFAVGVDVEVGDPRMYNPGYIETTPSKDLHGENDCFHYAVNGKLIFEPKWYEFSEQDSQGRCTIKVGKKTDRFFYLAALIEDQKTERQNLRSATYTLRSGANRWSKYDVQLTTLRVRHVMVDNQYSNSRFTIEWSETWTLIDHKGEVLKPSSTGGSTTFTASSTSTNYWVKMGPTECVVPAMDFYIYSLEMSRDSNLVDSLRWRVSQECSLGDLSAQAAESIRMLDINSIAYAKDLFQMADLAKGLTSLAQPSKGIKNLSKKAAKTYLAAHYGARLTIKDTQSIASAFDRYDSKHCVQRAGASKSVVVDLPGEPGIPVAVDLHLYARISSMAREDLNVVEAFKNFDRALMELDLVPTAANVWDMVPFSFVVDWFLPIGDALERRELASYVKTLDVQAAFYSRKYTWAKQLFWTVPGGTVSGPVSFKLYERFCQDSLAIPEMRVDKPKGLSKHWLEGSAILVSSL